MRVVRLLLVLSAALMNLAANPAAATTRAAAPGGAVELRRSDARTAVPDRATARAVPAERAGAAAREDRLAAADVRLTAVAPAAARLGEPDTELLSTPLSDLGPAAAPETHESLALRPVNGSDTPAVPEPSTCLLLALGLGIVWLLRRRGSADSFL